MAHGVTGITGIGTQFQRKDDLDAWNTIAHVSNITGPGMSREIVDTTTFDSTDGYRDKIGSLRDGGTVTFTMNFNRAGYLILKGDFEEDQPREYQIIIPDTESTTFTFSGLVTELPLTIPMDDKITADVTIEISGKVTTDADT